MTEVDTTEPAGSVPPAGRQTPIAVSFVVAIAGGAGLAITYALGGQNQLEGICLALALGGIGTGVVMWSKRFMPVRYESEPRAPLESSPADRAAFEADLAAGGGTFQRRRLLTWLLGGGLGFLGLASIFPIASLGPNPVPGLKSTPYRKGADDPNGIRLVDEFGNPIHHTEPNVNGVVTAFPEGSVGDEQSQTLVIHLREPMQEPLPGQEDWGIKLSVDGSETEIIAISKVCVHAGCPVGLFEEQSQLMLCPCHQSTFDLMEHARPVFGPASRPLPQLPIDLDDDGYIVARGDFAEPVGPGFWDMYK